MASDFQAKQGYGAFRTQAISYQKLSKRFLRLSLSILSQMPAAMVQGLNDGLECLKNTPAAHCPRMPPCLTGGTTASQPVL